MSGGVCHNPQKQRIIYLRLWQCSCILPCFDEVTFVLPIRSAFFFEKSVTVFAAKIYSGV